MKKFKAKKHLKRATVVIGRLKSASAIKPTDSESINRTASHKKGSKSRLSLGSAMSDFHSKELLSKKSESSVGQPTLPAITPEIIESMINNISADKLDLMSLLKVLPRIPSFEDIDNRIREFWIPNSKKLYSKITYEYNVLVESKFGELKNDMIIRVEELEEKLNLKHESLASRTQGSIKSIYAELEEIKANSLIMQAEILSQNGRIRNDFKSSNK